MLVPILLAALFLPAQKASSVCGDTGTPVAAETRPVRGPDRAVAVLNVSSADDHRKNSHLCQAEYQLLLTPVPGSAAKWINLLTTNSNYGRSLSLRLNGFSQNGNRVFGVLSEGGNFPLTILFDYDIHGRKVKLIDLNQQFAPGVAATCRAAFEVVGTTETGAIVVELDSAKSCAYHGRWRLNPIGGGGQRLPVDVSIQGLYETTFNVR
jgi:hypothetical protein